MPRTMSKLKLIAAMMAVVLAGYAVGAGIDRLRVPGVKLDRTASLDAIISGQGAPSTGPANAATTIVVFTDYQCGVCRIDHAGLARIVAARRDVRVVFKEWAVLGPVSRTAARATLAANYQGRYLAMRDAMMSRNPADVRGAAVAAGLDWPRLQRDLIAHRGAIETELTRTGWQAYGMGLPGTPAYLIGNRLVIGRLPEAKLRRMIGA